MAVVTIKAFQTSDGQQFTDLRLAERIQAKINAQALIDFKDKTYDDYIQTWTDPKADLKFPEFSQQKLMNLSENNFRKVRKTFLKHKVLKNPFCL